MLIAWASRRESVWLSPETRWWLRMPETKGICVCLCFWHTQGRCIKQVYLIHLVKSCFCSWMPNGTFSQDDGSGKLCIIIISYYVSPKKLARAKRDLRSAKPAHSFKGAKLYKRNWMKLNRINKKNEQKYSTSSGGEFCQGSCIRQRLKPKLSNSIK